MCVRKREMRCKGTISMSNLALSPWLCCVLFCCVVLCCAMFRDCCYPPHMINVQAIDWTCTVYTHTLCASVWRVCNMHLRPSLRIIWMKTAQHSLVIEVKWDCITESPGSNRCAIVHVLLHLCAAYSYVCA